MGQYLFWEPNRTFRGGSNLLLPLTNLMEAFIFKVVVSLAFLQPGLTKDIRIVTIDTTFGIWPKIFVCHYLKQ